MRRRIAKDVGLALALTLPAYAFVAVLLVLGGMEGAGPDRLFGSVASGLVLAVLPAATIFAYLVVDAALPLGQSKLEMLRGTVPAAERWLGRDGAWRLRVLVGLGAIIVIQVACDLAAA